MGWDAIGIMVLILLLIGVSEFVGWVMRAQVVGRRKHGFIRLDDHSTRKNAGRLLLQTPVE